MGHGRRGLRVEEGDEEEAVDEEGADQVDLGKISLASCRGVFPCTYHDFLAGPEALRFGRQCMCDGDNGVSNEGEGGGQRQPFEDTLLGVGDVVVGGALDEVAEGIGGRQRLASRAGGGGFGDISIRFRGDYRARSEGRQEPHKQYYGIDPLQHGDGAA